MPAEREVYGNSGARIRVRIELRKRLEGNRHARQRAYSLRDAGIVTFERPPGIADSDTANRFDIVERTSRVVGRGHWNTYEQQLAGLFPADCVSSRVA